NKRSKFFFAIIDKNTGDYIGEIGFIRKSKSIFGDIMELGYFIREVYWGKGIVTEASKSIMSYAFNNWNTRKVVTGCVVENKASEGIMKKLGMIKEAELKNHVVLHNNIHDRVEYRILKEEWEELYKNKKTLGIVKLKKNPN
ncbi:N-acetyltransferase, partial [Filobacillus milosensis]